MNGNLRTIVGIDEAGYGPRLGPLVVGLAAFRAPMGCGDLRELLPLTRPGGPVPVADSKLLYRGGADLGRLERSVLAFRRHAREAGLPDRRPDPAPWEPGGPALHGTPAAPEAVGEAAALLGEALRDSGVEVLALRTRTVPVAEFNGGVARTGSKAEVLFGAVAELMAPFLDGAGATVIHVDRQGGRTRYSRPLASHFPGRAHLAVREEPRVSAYRFPRAAGTVTVTFEVEADGRYLETALASMAAKWVRELHVRALNDWFGGRQPGLRPTAGYAADAGRWLRETTGLRARLGVRDDDLVRSR